MCQNHEDRFNLNTTFVTEAKPIPGSKKFRTTVSDVIQDLDGMFREGLRQMQTILLSASNREGQIPPSQHETLVAQVGQVALNLFVSSDGRSSWRAGRPLSPFAEILTYYYIKVVAEAVQAQATWMQKRMPDDLLAQFQQIPPRMERTWEARQKSLYKEESHFAEEDDLDDLRIFKPNPLAELDPNRQWVPMLRWNDPNGYVLSDRVWRAGEESRRAIDRMLMAGLRAGRGALDLSQDLEQFLLPSQQGIRTDKPYGYSPFNVGRNANYPALRLARTELARAANHASFIASYLNPYVDRMDVARSPNGDRSCTLCPPHATIGFDGQPGNGNNGANRAVPYNLNTMNGAPYHPNCMCAHLPVPTDTIETVTQRLRQGILADLQPFVTPLLTHEFIRFLTSDIQGSIVAQVLNLLL